MKSKLISLFLACTLSIGIVTINSNQLCNAKTPSNIVINNQQITTTTNVYGATMKISKGEPIPKGWAITGEGATITSQKYYNIVNLNGGKCGDWKVVTDISTLPENWVITKYTYDSNNKKYYTVTCLNGAPDGYSLAVAKISKPQIPEGWLIVDRYSTDNGLKVFYVIKLYKNTKYNDTVSVVSESKIPNGWVITYFKRLKDYRLFYAIKNLNGGEYGHTQTVLSNSIVPTEWDWVIVGNSFTDNGFVEYYSLKCLRHSPIGRTETVLKISKIPKGWTVVSEGGTQSKTRVIKKVS